MFPPEAQIPRVIVLDLSDSLHERYACEARVLELIIFVKLYNCPYADSFL